MFPEAILRSQRNKTLCFQRVIPLRSSFRIPGHFTYIFNILYWFYWYPWELKSIKPNYAAPRTFNDSQLNLQVKSFLIEKSSTMLITWITDVKKAKNIRGVAKHNGLSFNRYSRSVAKIGGISRANISGVAVITSTLNAGDCQGLEMPLALPSHVYRLR